MPDNRSNSGRGGITRKLPAKPTAGVQRQPIKPGAPTVQAKAGPARKLAPPVVQPKATPLQGARPATSMAPLKPGQQRQGLPNPGGLPGGIKIKPPFPLGGLKTIQAAKKKAAGSPAWLKTWRNINCYASDTAKAMGKRMTEAAIEVFIRGFLAEYANGVRGHCSEAMKADAVKSGHTDNDLEVWHSYYRKNRPW